MAVEEPPFHLVRQAGAFEVRDYPALVAAETTVQGDPSAAANRGFRILAAYIFGDNVTRGRIAMTAPVSQAPSPQGQSGGEKIDMTAPVSQIPASGGAWTIRFTMPRQWTLATLPRPKDPRVRLVEVAPVRMAVLRFSGYALQNAVKTRSAELLAWTHAQGYRVTGPVTLAQYDPPWTLWFLRRNEVMAPIAP